MKETNYRITFFFLGNEYEIVDRINKNVFIDVLRYRNYLFSILFHSEIFNELNVGWIYFKECFSLFFYFHLYKFIFNHSYLIFIEFLERVDEKYKKYLTKETNVYIFCIFITRYICYLFYPICQTSSCIFKIH